MNNLQDLINRDVVENYTVKHANYFNGIYLYFK
jgi:hypothetical protein